MDEAEYTQSVDDPHRPRSTVHACSDRFYRSSVRYRMQKNIGGYKLAVRLSQNVTVVREGNFSVALGP
jgi:hypothetical protein